MFERMAIKYNKVAKKIVFKFKIKPGRPVECGAIPKYKENIEHMM